MNIQHSYMNWCWFILLNLSCCQVNKVHLSLSLSLSLSLRFNSHFPGEPGLAGVYWSKGWWRWWWQLDYWSYKLWKAPVKSSQPTNQHPVFYRPDALPVAQPTVSEHWRENITFHGLAYPKLTWCLPTLSLITNSFWFPWGGLPCLSSVPQVNKVHVCLILYHT